ncbi:MAG: ATP-binding protein [Acidobacteria bacterium]|nr:ATP-binding protein [Acidobacteriota bacterium]
MIELPTTIVEIEKLITNKVQENIHLDYKASPAIDHSKRDEIAKDVSAFANSDGGLLIYGVTEDSNKFPEKIDEGIDHNKYGREWLEQIISSKINPRLDGVRLAPIPVSNEKSIYAVSIPKSFRGPHQAPDKKYYKRFNFQSVPMEHYEINDARSRQRIITPLVSVDVDISSGVMVYLTVANYGDQPAEDVSFELPDELTPWIVERGENLFTRGIKYLSPQREFKFYYGGYTQSLAGNGGKASKFEIRATYFHPSAGEYITETFHIDLKDFYNSAVTHSEIYEHGQKVKKAIDDLKSEVHKLNENLAKIANISDPTGLSLSVSSLKNLKHIASEDHVWEKIDPCYQESSVFMEVLGVDRDMAYRLSYYFRQYTDGQGLANLEGMGNELLQKIEECFILRSESQETELEGRRQ